MKKVFTAGVFDVFHYGHLRLLQRARTLGDYLMVGVKQDDSIHLHKPGTIVVYSTAQRMEMVTSIKYVDEALEFSDIAQIITQIKCDIFVVGEDQSHAGFKQAIAYCEKHGIAVVRLTRTHNVSSSSLKQKIEAMFL